MNIRNSSLNCILSLNASTVSSSIFPLFSSLLICSKTFHLSSRVNLSMHTLHIGSFPHLCTCCNLNFRHPRFFFCVRSSTNPLNIVIFFREVLDTVRRVGTASVVVGPSQPGRHGVFAICPSQRYSPHQKFDSTGCTGPFGTKVGWIGRSSTPSVE